MKKASKTPPSILQRKSTTSPHAQIFPILTGYDELANYLSPLYETVAVGAVTYIG